MKDNNKKIFLGVIVVATLIIAIVGATFAFFSASGGSTNNALTANATTLTNLGFVSSHSKIATNLVPVTSESPYFSRYPGIAASGEHSCLDDVGNQICSIYEFTITNTASVAQTIYVSFVPSENTFDNMYFAAFNTSIASASYVVATGSSGSGSNFTLIPQTTVGNSTLGHQATKLTKNSTSPIDMPGLSTSLNAGSSITYTILVWLQETGATQNTEQGETFKAGVNVTTGGNSTGVTGVMGGSNYTVYTINNNLNEINIGKPISNDITKYTSAVSAMIDYGQPMALKQVVGNYSGYCLYEIGVDNEVFCLANGSTLAACESVASASEWYSEGYECRLTKRNGVVVESYALFANKIPSNPSDSVNIYEIKGGDGGISYTANVETIRVLNNNYCTNDTEQDESYVTSSYTRCDGRDWFYDPVADMNVDLQGFVYESGGVTLHTYQDHCYVTPFGASFCYAW